MPSLIQKAKYTAALSWRHDLISDTGKGIPKDKLKFIFKPFTRVVDSKSTVPGFGMGLAIVAGIIRLLKGTIHISSEVNVGTTVTVREGANKRGNSSRLTQSFHFFMFEPIFSPVNALNQPI